MKKIIKNCILYLEDREIETENWLTDNVDVKESMLYNWQELYLAFLRIWMAIGESFLPKEV